MSALVVLLLVISPVLAAPAAAVPNLVLADSPAKYNQTFPPPGWTYQRQKKGECKVYKQSCKASDFPPTDCKNKVLGETAFGQACRE